MTSPFPNLTDTVLVSKAALDAAVSQLPDIAQMAANAQATADAAMPKSMIGTAPGDVVALDAQARLPAVDGSQLTSVVAHSTLPALIVELGHSMQASDGRGVDRGSWYQVNLGIGTNALSGFQLSVNDDGSANLAAGTYLVCCGAKIIADSADTYQLPAQMTVATGQACDYPGVYQYAVQRLPDLPLSSTNTAGVLGYISFSGVARWGVDPVWLGFSKILGSSNQVPLRLQGYLSFVKMG
ncbi:hypothetical protein ACS7SF_17010 [Ralstonia sp. 25C]|uniref:hypothetical protein n=1 Tax=Ralstonia sp. 25C TaxID=3447363 RepID=UPI003F756AC4